MSFAQSVKSEICGRSRFTKRCCLISQLYGMLLFSAVFESGRTKLSGESIDAIKRFSSLAEELVGSQSDITVTHGEEQNFTATVQGEDASRLFSLMGYAKGDIGLRINRGVFDCEDCAAAFASGAFLAAGSITLPDKAYRCEIATTKQKRLLDLRTLLQENGIEALLTRRKASNVLYLKASESIEDFLNLIGAPNAAFDLMNVKIYKDLRNRANRAANCETANILKNVEAAYEQREAIKKLMKRGAVESLPPELAEAAQLRLENPESSIAELAGLAEPKVSKSGMANRLTRLIRISKE